MTARGSNGHAEGATVLAERYRLEELVAAGGMGEVWRATDMLLERTVAVKLLRESLAEDPVLAERFRREALTTARLSHPNMANVFDYVQDEGRPGIVMEFVEGETLAERIARDGALDVADAVSITSGMLGALERAHEAGVVHRDVKPGNVMLSPSRVKVTDFGIARAAGHETLTETGMVVGTAHYLSPEQVSGKAATPASDLYAVGAILYEMLTGVRPFEADTPLAVAMRRLTDDPASPEQVRAGVPKPVADVAMHALAREPQGRFRSAEDMRSALETAFASGAAATAPRRTDPTPTMKLPTVAEPSAPTVALRPEPVTPVTGSSPSAAVAERRRGDYRRGIVWLVAVALIVGGATMGILALGRGSGPVSVPDFMGMQITDARALADDRGLSVEEVQAQSDRPAGEVIAQDVPAATRVADGETVTLTVSTGQPATPLCCEIPDLTGKTKDEAKEALEAVGLELGGTREEASDAEPGTVIDQDPSPGETADPGDEVDIVVAKERKGHGKGNGD